MNLGEVVRHLVDGTELPERCAVITVDDAYRSFLAAGWPLLQQYGFPATLFVSTDTVGSGDFLSWPELKALMEQGVELGNHSATHPYMLDALGTPEWARAIQSELHRSQAAFKQHLGFTPQLFAYPYGEFTPELADLVREAGFLAAFGQQSGVISSGQDLFALPRFPVGGPFAALDRFREKMSMKHLPLFDVTPKDTIVKEINPPELIFYLKDAAVARQTLRCFVPGQAECRVVRREGEEGRYQVKAQAPLAGRRSKYTITASDTSGRTWYWYSKLWVLPEHGPVSDDPVAR